MILRHTDPTNPTASTSQVLELQGYATIPSFPILAATKTLVPSVLDPKFTGPGDAVKEAIPVSTVSSVVWKTVHFQL